MYSKLPIRSAKTADEFHPYSWLPPSKTFSLKSNTVKKHYLWSLHRRYLKQIWCLLHIPSYAIWGLTQTEVFTWWNLYFTLLNTWVQGRSSLSKCKQRLSLNISLKSLGTTSLKTKQNKPTTKNPTQTKHHAHLWDNAFLVSWLSLWRLHSQPAANEDLSFQMKRGEQQNNWFFLCRSGLQ